MKCVSQVHVSGYVNNKMKIFWGVDKLGVENATSWWRGRHVTQPSLLYHIGRLKNPFSFKSPTLHTQDSDSQARQPPHSHWEARLPVASSHFLIGLIFSASAFSSPNTWLQVAEHHLALTDGPRTSLQSAPRHATTTKPEHES